MRAHVTLGIDIDAFSPELNDGTVDVSETIIRIIREALPDHVIVEHNPEKVICTFVLDGDFQEIQP